MNPRMYLKKHSQNTQKNINKKKKCDLVKKNLFI